MAQVLSKRSSAQMFKQYPDVVSVKQICEMLRISRNYAYMLIKTGQIRRMDSCRIIRVTKLAVIEYAEQNSQP